MLEQELYHYPAAYDANGRLLYRDRRVVRTWAIVHGTNMRILVLEEDYEP